ncbi:hypothetical protein MC885_015267 [Smutsia gigantea]|nr:hypothetical protein MC885_015267 [Smutsia gigantea]
MGKLTVDRSSEKEKKAGDNVAEWRGRRFRRSGPARRSAEKPNRPTWARPPRPAALTPPDCAVPPPGTVRRTAGSAGRPGPGIPAPGASSRCGTQGRRAGRAPPGDQMFAIQPGVAEGGQFLGAPPPGVCQPELQPDNNSNFMVSTKDANENWHGMPGQVEPILMRSSSQSPSDNQAFQAPGLPEGEVRSPPEGAEIPGAEHEKMGGASTVCSPLEDNGYASSSLSIDSSSSSPEPACGTPRGHGPADPLLPSVARAVQQLQAQERYKEQEKEKHHMHLVMYRRLALLQWIRALQHQLAEQQAPCCAFLDIATLDAGLVWSIPLKYDCLGQEEPQFGFPGWTREVLVQPLEILGMLGHTPFFYRMVLQTGIDRLQQKL